MFRGNYNYAVQGCRLLELGQAVCGSGGLPHEAEHAAGLFGSVLWRNGLAQNAAGQAGQGEGSAQPGVGVQAARGAGEGPAAARPAGGQRGGSPEREEPERHLGATPAPQPRGECPAEDFGGELDSCRRSGEQDETPADTDARSFRGSIRSGGEAGVSSSEGARRDFAAGHSHGGKGPRCHSNRAADGAPAAEQSDSAGRNTEEGQRRHINQGMKTMDALAISILYVLLLNFTLCVCLFLVVTNLYVPRTMKVHYNMN